MSVLNVAMTGLTAATMDLQVTGNNVANAGTYGFKQSRMEFSDLMPSGPQGNQVGNGVQIAGVGQNFSSNGMATTGNPFDFAIRNGGFFVVKDINSGSTTYTRAGNFKLDQDGYLTTQSGDFVQGYLESNGVIGNTVGNLKIPNGDVLPPKASGSVKLDLNLDATADTISLPFDANDDKTYNYSSSVNVYDSLGGTHNVNLYYAKSSDNNWNVNVFADGSSIGSGSLTFSNAGVYQSATGLSSLSFNPGGGAAPSQGISVDLSASTQYGSAFLPRDIDVDGYPTGQSGDISVSGDGVLSMQYSNGQTKAVGKVAIANFENPQGLFSTGDTSWRETYESGQALISPENSNGAIRGGALENSNVDLTAQLVKLMTAQRTFQANAQSIRAGDVLTQTIINIE